MLSTTAHNYAKKPRKKWRFLVIFGLFLAALLGAFLWIHWIYTQIDRFAYWDQAAPSDAICIFGAAEYDGRPSPVFRARLDHAYSLFQRGIAPLIITLGGAGGDEFSEGEVGRQYLVGQGVPESAIIAETQSRNTLESARRVAVIARANGLKRMVIVSDGTHLFRIHEICAKNGLNVLTSPRPHQGAEGDPQKNERMVHEIISYTLWRLHLD